MAIVVGVDGSDESAAALRWAVDEARLRGVGVQAVHVYQPQGTLAYGYVDAPLAPEVIDQNMQAARQSADELLAAAIGRVQTADVTIEPILVDDVGPAGALVRQSQDAELLVVGSRGRGGFQELLLGSVSHQCANHATCPVVIVREPAPFGSA